MDKATVDELYQLAAYARTHELMRALAWLMRGMQAERPKLPRGIKARLVKGGFFWMDPGKLKGMEDHELEPGPASDK